MMYVHLLSFYILSHIFVLINLLSLVVLLCQLYNSTAIVAILIKLLLKLLLWRKPSHSYRLPDLTTPTAGKSVLSMIVAKVCLAKPELI